MTDTAQSRQPDEPSSFKSLLPVATSVSPGAIPPGICQPASQPPGAGHEPFSSDRISSSQGQPLDDRIEWHIQEKHPTGKERGELERTPGWTPVPESRVSIVPCAWAETRVPPLRGSGVQGGIRAGASLPAEALCTLDSVTAPSPHHSWVRPPRRQRSAGLGGADALSWCSHTDLG